MDLTFPACPPCKLKLYTWSQIDHMIDTICNGEGEKYRTELLTDVDPGNVAALKRTSTKEKEKATSRLAGGEKEPGPSTRSKGGKKQESSKGGKKAAEPGQ